jgi:hypothetical protein
MKQKTIILLTLIILLAVLTGCVNTVDPHSIETCETQGGDCMDNEVCMQMSSWVSIGKLDCADTNVERTCCMSVLKKN